MQNVSKVNKPVKPLSNVKRGLSFVLVVALLALPISCAKPPAGEPPAHCTVIQEWPLRGEVAREMSQVFKPAKLDGIFRATRFPSLADRLDYLEAECIGVNAYRGEKDTQ